MQKVKKEKNIPPVKSDMAKAAKKRDTIRALQTYFRTSYRVHTSLSALADRKSNIMIKLNSIIISILIVFFKYITEVNPAAFIAVIIFLVTTLLSLVFATMAARPQITNVNNSGESPETIKSNLFFFGNYVNLDKKLYDASFRAMMKKNRLIYDNMINDLYYLGKVLHKKFRYIYWSYNIFLIGLVTTVFTFLIVFFMAYY